MASSDTCDCGSLPPDVNHGPSINAVNWTEGGFGVLILLIRLYTRIFIVRKIGWDDWCIVLAVILSLVMSALVTVEIHYGFGRHAAYISPPSLIQALKFFWISSPFAVMSAMFGKISIALLLLRIIGKGRHKAYKAILWILILLLLAVHIVVPVVNFAQCSPTWWLWEQFNPETREAGRCWDPNIQKKYGYFQGAFAAFSDLLLALFPILIIRGLHIDTKLKLALCGVMSLGLVATAAAIVKTIQLKNLATPDFTWNGASLIYWYVSETWIIVIAACIPTLAPLYFIAAGDRTAGSYAAGGSKGQSGMGKKGTAGKSSGESVTTAIEGGQTEGGKTEGAAGGQRESKSSGERSSTQSQEGITKTTRVDVQKEV